MRIRFVFLLTVPTLLAGCASQKSLIAEHARAIVDTRHALRDVPHDPRKVLLLGGGTF